MSKNLLNLLLIIGSVTVYFVVISPIYFGGGSLFVVDQDKSIISLLKFKNENDKAFQQLKDGIDNMSSLKNEYGSISKDTLDKLNIMIPDSIDTIRLVSEINTMVKDLGLQAEDFSFSKGGEDKRFPSVGVYSVSFSVKCSYADLRSLLSKFESSTRLYPIQSVSFSSGLNLNEPMAVNIKMNTYYIK